MDDAWVAGVVAGLLSSSVVAMLSYLLAHRQEVQRERRQDRRDAADDLAPALRELRVLAVRRGWVEVTQPEVAAAVARWVDAFDRRRHFLPDEGPHLGASVRAAIGEIFGAVSLSDVRPDLESFPLPEPDRTWQDHAEAYLDHVVDRIVRWGAGQRGAAPAGFDAWLTRTGRLPSPDAQPYG